jgi:hypothetical protein
LTSAFIRCSFHSAYTTSTRTRWHVPLANGVTYTEVGQRHDAGMAAVVDAVRREERVRVVAWLRERARMVTHGEILADGYGTAVTYREAADAIERGEHERSM